VVLHHKAAIAFLGVLSYGLFCRIKEAFRPFSVTPVQFTWHANWPFDRVAATLRESPGVVVEEFDLKSQWRFMHAAILPPSSTPAALLTDQAAFSIPLDSLHAGAHNSLASHILVGLLVSARNCGGELKLVSPRKRVKDLLRRTTLHAIFGVYENNDEAVAAFRKKVA
jgi:hypothetical protein